MAEEDEEEESIGKWLEYAPGDKEMVDGEENGGF